MIKNYSNRQGFALLYAILLSGAVLSIGLILMNIITKQLVFSSLNRESETTYYYLANSGRECLLHYANLANGNFYSPTFDMNTFTIQYDFFDGADIKCSLFGENPIYLTSVNFTSDYPKYTATISVPGGGNQKMDLSITFNRLCLEGVNCHGDTLIKKSIAVIVADGYSGAGNRLVKRSAVSVIR